MDLRLFYQKLRKIEAEIGEPHVVVVSNETSDGGRAGQKSEVSRANAAKLLVEGRARLANTEEVAEFRATVEHARQDAEQRTMSQKIQVHIVPESDHRAIKSISRPEKR